MALGTYTVKSNITGNITIRSEDEKSAVLCALFRMKLIKSVQEVVIKNTTSKTAHTANVKVVDERGAVYFLHITITPTSIMY